MILIINNMKNKYFYKREFVMGPQNFIINIENQNRKQIVSFALQAKELFNKSSEKIISNEFERSMYTDFWTEYNHLLNKYNKKHCNQCFLL